MAFIFLPPSFLHRFPSAFFYSHNSHYALRTTHHALRSTHHAPRTTHYRNHHHHHHHDTTARVVCFHYLHLDGKNAGTMGCTTPIVLIPLLMLIMSMTILPARCLSCNSGNTFYEKYTCHANEMASKFSVNGLVCLDTQIMNHIGTYSLNTCNSIAAEMNRKLANTGCPKVVIPCYDGRRSSSTNGLGYFIQLESDCSSGLSRCTTRIVPCQILRVVVVQMMTTATATMATHTATRTATAVMTLVQRVTARLKMASAVFHQAARVKTQDMPRCN